MFETLLVDDFTVRDYTNQYMGEYHGPWMGIPVFNQPRFPK